MMGNKIFALSPPLSLYKTLFCYLPLSKPFSTLSLEKTLRFISLSKNLGGDCGGCNGVCRFSGDGRCTVVGGWVVDCGGCDGDGGYSGGRRLQW
ncbi:hypothetical protein HanPI659440_Chr07g0273721 [Helianthus annuus]|nr:hypothetical protein HanPI659440_Chr07g0273721 [Helianthus annuus]